MSRIFSITPPDGHRPISVGEALEIGPAGLRPYGIEDVDYDVILDLSTADIVCLLGIDPYSSRGFEFEFSDGSYSVRLLTPSSPNDWRIALDFLAALARRLGVVIDGDDGPLTPDAVVSFPYRDDIRSGMDMIRSTMAQHPDAPMRVSGIRRPVSLTQAMMARVFAAQVPEDEFGETLRAIQHLDAYDARPMVARSSRGEVLGIFTLTESTRTILPMDPALSEVIRREVGEDTRVDWRLALIGLDGPSDQASSYRRSGETSYHQALHRLPPHKVRVFDGESILVDGLTGAEIGALLGQ